MILKVLAAVSLILAVACSKSRIPPDISERYLAEVDALCKSYASCLEKKITNTVPEQSRKEVSYLISRDFCKRQRYKPIGIQFQDPVPPEPIYNREDYENYHLCAQKILIATSCEEKFQLRKEDPFCKKVFHD